MSVELSRGGEMIGTTPEHLFFVLLRSWAATISAFGVSTYTDLSAARYDEVVRYVKDQYRALTGHDLDAVEQAGMEGLDGE